MGPRRTLSGLSAFPLASSEPTGQERPLESSEGELGAGRGHTTHLALATHSMVTSEVPATTLVFLGGMMMVGAMGSAGPPTSGERAGVSGRGLGNPAGWCRGRPSSSRREAGGHGAAPPAASEPNLRTPAPGTPHLSCPSADGLRSVHGEPTGDLHGLPTTSITRPCPPLIPPTASLPSKSFPPPAFTFPAYFFIFHLFHQNENSPNRVDACPLRPPRPALISTAAVTWQ